MAKLSGDQLDAMRAMCDVAPDGRCVLIGASAILCHELPLRRLTMDVDFAVSGPGEAVYAPLDAAGWKRHSKMRQRWYRGAAQIDLIAATDEEVRAGEVHLDDGFVLSVVGFDLAFRETSPVEVASGVTVRVPPPSVLVLLKMISWLDRNDREKDLGDILLMLDESLDEVDDRRFDLSHPVGASGVDYEDQGAFFLGWDLGTRADAPHLHWANRFLDRMADRDSVAFAQLVRAAKYGGDEPEARVAARLHAFSLGLQQGSPQMVAAQRHASASRKPAQLEIHDAIDARRVLSFQYDGYERIVQPHVLGIKNGRLQILTWQTGGMSSRGGLPDWRRFDVAKMSNLAETGDTFSGSRPTTGRPSPFDRQIAIVR